jgi:hypothetical protein
MSEAPLSDLTVELARRFGGGTPTRTQEDAIRAAIENNGLGSPDSVPPWLVALFRDVLDGTQRGDVSFAFDEIVGGRGDVVSFLADLAELIPFDYDNYGEGIEIGFGPLARRVFICLEAREPFYRVSVE